MKLFKQILCLMLVAGGFLLFDISIYTGITKRFINNNSEEMKAKSIEIDRFLPFEAASEIVKITSSQNPFGDEAQIDTNDLPVVDGAAALFPVFSAFVNATYPSDSVSFLDGDFADESKLQYRNTRGAYKAVVDGDVDIVFCAMASKEQLEYAKQNEVDLEFVPIGKEAFVFFVNKDNAVDDLSIQELKDIYAGNISNWKTVGGENKGIDVTIRNEGSGSQTALLNFMGEMPVKKKPSLGNASAIGFSFRYYIEEIVKNGGVKLLSIEGVYPDIENIANDKYPLTSEFYAVYDKSNTNENIQVFINWILSEEGQEIIEKSGYVPLD